MRQTQAFSFRAASAAFCLFGLLLISGRAAGDPAPERFDIPAGDAADTLGRFSAQAGEGERVLYSADGVAGVRTNAVRGKFTASDAINLMLSGTALEALLDSRTGTITIRRKAPTSSGPPAGEAQSDQVPPRAPEQIVEMSQFEVTTTQGHGYVSTNAATGFKTDEALMNLPQADIVVTSDLIKDVGYENTSDILKYFGVMAVTGDALSLRGNSTLAFIYVDEMPLFADYQDDVVIDSIEVVKGPAQTLYQSAPLGGIILETTKKPLPFNQDSLTGMIDNNGLFRFTEDFTGPLGKISYFDISYRLIASYQKGNEYFTNAYNDREVLFPEFQVRFNNTTLRLYYLLETIKIPYGEGFLTPSGNLFTGAGWKAANNQLLNGEQEWEGKTIYVEILQKLSDNWENRFSGAFWDYNIFGPYPYPDVIDFDNRTETFVDYLANEKWKFWTAQDDWQGHYEFGPAGWEMENRDALGFAYTSRTDKQAYWNDAPFPYPNGPAGGTVTVPIDTPAAERVLSPPVSAFPFQANGLNEYIQNELSSIYWQHTIDVIPNWLTLVAGLDWATITTQTILNWAVLPFQATDSPVSQTLHRLGAVLHLTNQISIYALDSTNFTPAFGGEILENGSLPPPEVGKGTELGLKFNFLGGKISGESAWFKMVTTNALNSDAGSFANGLAYSAIIGSVTEEGVDGDAAFAILPGLQVIGSFYAGHEIDPYGNPTPRSFDNSWGTFVRYDFPKVGTLRGVGFGGGVSRVGGRWTTNSQLVYTQGPLPTYIKLQTGTEVEGFLNYALNRHWMFRVNCNNILNQAYPLYYENAAFVTPSNPRTWSFQSTYNF